MADAYRRMNEEPGTGRPAISVPPGVKPLMLAVRIGTAPGPSIDIVAGSLGVVAPGSGGLSVNSSLDGLPWFTVPRRLRRALPLKNFREAAGGNETRIWSHPVPSFPSTAAEPVSFAAGLVLGLHRPGKGFVEPERSVMREDYQAAIQATRSTWVINEPSSPTERPTP